jgi:hypothetical protein
VWKKRVSRVPEHSQADVDQKVCSTPGDEEDANGRHEDGDDQE